MATKARKTILVPSKSATANLVFPRQFARAIASRSVQVLESASRAAQPAGPPKK